MENKRVSLMHNVLTEPLSNINSNTTIQTNSDKDEWTFLHSHVWKVDNSPHFGVFIDISTRHEDELTITQIAKQQFPNFMGVIPLREGKRQVLLELAFDDESEVEPCSYFRT